MDFNINPIEGKNLYRIDRYGDLATGELLVFVPVTTNLVEDPVRQRIFQGSCGLTFSNGQQTTTNFPIEALNAEQAIELWAAALKFHILALESNAVRQRILNGAGVPSQPIDPDSTRKAT